MGKPAKEGGYQPTYERALLQMPFRKPVDISYCIVYNHLVLHPDRNWSLEPSASHHCVVKISRWCHRIAVEILHRACLKNLTTKKSGILTSLRLYYYKIANTPKLTHQTKAVKNARFIILRFPQWKFRRPKPLPVRLGALRPIAHIRPGCKKPLPIPLHHFWDRCFICRW